MSATQFPASGAQPARRGHFSTLLTLAPYLWPKGETGLRARVVIASTWELPRIVTQLRAAGERVAVIVHEAEPGPGAAQVWRVPEDPELAGYARELYAALRGLDAGGVGVIVAEAVPERGLGRVIMDRLRRAAAR